MINIEYTDDNGEITSEMYYRETHGKIFRALDLTEIGTNAMVNAHSGKYLKRVTVEW